MFHQGAGFWRDNIDTAKNFIEAAPVW